MSENWKPALAAIASLIAGVGGTVATQRGRVASEANELYEKRIADRVRMELVVSRLEEDVKNMGLRLFRAEADLAVMRWNKTPPTSELQP